MQGIETPARCVPVSSPLLLQEMSAADLRCHHQVQWQCTPGLNMVMGENGSGKTSLLEAVFLMGHGRSFRQARDPVLSRWESKGFLVIGKWKRYGPLHVEVSGRGKSNRIYLQKRQIQRRMELIETLPVLVESPQGARLVDGVPGERRRWLDQMMLYCRPDVARHYHAYLRCLMQRSRLLRRGGSSDEIEVWEHQMTAHGSVLMQARAGLVDDLNRILESELPLSESGVRVSIHSTAPAEKDVWFNRLVTQRRKGQPRGILRIGPHCDRIMIDYGGRNIRSCGSRGQQKLAAVAIRLAECALRMQHRGFMPLLLLDDCLEALDPLRQQRLLERLAVHSGQILMSGPSGTHIPVGFEMNCYKLPDPVQKNRDKMQPVMADMEAAG